VRDRGKQGVALVHPRLYRRFMTEFRTYSITASRLSLNIVEWGDPQAPPLVLVHGGRDHARAWDEVARAFAPRWRVIVPDLRGHGDSEWVNDGIYQIHDHLQDLITLSRKLDLPPCPYIGHSLGGNVVTRFAGLYPDRVSRLVNIEGLGEPPALAAERAKRDQVVVLRDWLEKRIRLAEFEPRPHADADALGDRMAALDAHIPRAKVMELLRLGTRANPDGSVTLKYDPAISPAPPDLPQDVKHRLWAAITCPILLIYGAQSWASNPAVDGRAQLFRNARVELIEGAGHWLHHDQPEIFIALVTDFLA